jgi:CBS domain-containing protein
LISHGISSAPVYNSENNEYSGMLDFRDIVDYVLTVFRKKCLQPISEDEAIGISEIIHRATSGESIPAEAIVGTSHLSAFLRRFITQKPILLCDVTYLIGGCC